jgi:hypothetical protein
MNRFESSEDLPRKLERTPSIYYESFLTTNPDLVHISAYDASHEPTEEIDDNDSSSSSENSSSVSQSLEYSRESSPEPVSKKILKNSCRFPRVPVPSIGSLIMIVSMCYTLFNSYSGNLGNTIAGGIIAAIFATSINIPILANPVPLVRNKIIILILVYLIFALLWGNFRIYEYITTTRVPIRYLTYINRNTWRAILWPGDLLAFIMKNIVAFLRSLEFNLESIANFRNF